MRLFFLKIPKPLKQHPIYKKTIHSAISKDLGKKLTDPSTIFNDSKYAFKPLILSLGIVALKHDKRERFPAPLKSCVFEKDLLNRMKEAQLSLAKHTTM